MKIKKRDLARGTALSTAHWNENKSQLENLLSGEIDTENLTLNNGKFSMTFNWPRLVVEDFTYTANVAVSDPRYEVETQGLNVPILLPPLQDQWTKQIGTAEMPKLVSMSVSFDTYMQNYAVLSDTNNVGPFLDNQNVMPGFANRYALEIELREKEQSFFSVNASTALKSQNIAPKTIYKTTVGGETFNSDVARFNPVFITGIDKLFHPKRTYLLKINFPELYTVARVTERFAPVSLTVKLDFETRLVEKDDKGSAPEYGVQNFPLNETITAPTTALDTAVAGAKISARGGIADNGRIQTNIEQVDELAVNGITSGYDIRSNYVVNQYVQPDASYFCMVVPMFGGCLDIRSSDLNTVGQPFGPLGSYGGLNPSWTGKLIDQRLIPISQPFTIHHVFAVHDYGSHAVPAGAPLNPERPRTNTAMQPISPTFRRRIGVGIASGLRSESKRYEQVAYLETLGDTKFGALVDQITDGLIPPDYGAMTISYGPLQTPGYMADQEIFQVPLVPNVTGGQNTRGYFDQGEPYFVGKSNLSTFSRSPVGIIGGGTRFPLTSGEELFLDVRWMMDDTGPTGLSYDDPTPADGPFEFTQYVGTSKCWVYIIGKMPTAT